jgi:putative phosphoesterase
MQIGVISDTHNFFDPAIPQIFQGVDHILHAGDIGSPRIILELEQIAPVTAVGGNTDESGFHYQETEVLELAGLKFLLHHIVAPRELSDSLAQRIGKERPDAVIFGHTHKPFCERISGTLFFNPGYAGKSRFGMERSVAVLDCARREIKHRYTRLI